MTQTVHVSVANRPVEIATSAAIQGMEGNAVSLQVEFADPGILDTHTADIDWGDGSTSIGQVSGANGQGTVTDHHTYADNGQYVIVLQVTDEGDAVAVTEIPAQIGNLAPSVSVDGPYSGNVHDPLTFVFSADDPSATDMQSEFTYRHRLGRRWPGGPDSRGASHRPGS